MGISSADRNPGNIRGIEVFSVPAMSASGTFERADDPDPRRFDCLIQALRLRAAVHPDSPAFVFLNHDEAPACVLTYRDLDRRVTRLAIGLRARGLTGQRILLQHPQGPEFAVAFFAVLAAGAVAVPAPHTQTRRGGAQRLQAIVQDAAPALALTTPEQADLLRATLAGTPFVLTEADVTGIDPPRPDPPRTDQPETGLTARGPLGLAPAEAGLDLPVPQPGALAFLQYTSGSTGVPKGVMISHGAIMANQRLIAARFGHDRATVMVSWLPMFHDMGLIGSLLQPVYAGFPCVMMAPDAFLEDPARWLRAITTYQATTAGAPNFAYDFCVDRIAMADRAGLDLRSWRVAFNGSEPVRARTLERFASAFAPYGFRASSAYPCYGMAEATLLIAGGTPGTPPVVVARPTPEGQPRQIVSSGFTEPDHQIAIVDPATVDPASVDPASVDPASVDPATVDFVTGSALGDDAEGEIWVRGPSLAMGYWQNPEATARSFGAALAGRGTGWMRTGDLGLLHDGQLFVSGRLKDVIIVKGRNHHPSDIEATAVAAHPDLRPEGGAAFVVETDDRATLVLLHEVNAKVLRAPPVAQIAGALRAAISAHHGLHLAVVALIAPGTLPKTTSGKVRRSLARENYLDGTLPVLCEDRHGPALRRDPTVLGELPIS